MCWMGRCPGRAFAEAELAMIVALLLSTYEMRLARKPCASYPRAARRSVGTDAAAGEPVSRMRPHGAGPKPSPGDPDGLLPAPDMRRHGAGSRPSPGDPDGLLPAPELRRQVGVRWPMGACHVIVVQRRTLSQA